MEGQKTLCATLSLLRNSTVVPCTTDGNVRHKHQTFLVDGDVLRRSREGFAGDGFNVNNRLATDSGDLAVNCAGKGRGTECCHGCVLLDERFLFMCSPGWNNVRVACRASRQIPARLIMRWSGTVP